MVSEDRKQELDAAGLSEEQPLPIPWSVLETLTLDVLGGLLNQVSCRHQALSSPSGAKEVI